MVDRAPRILLVDDEHAIQTLLSYPLRKDGYEVVQATDGRAALARFAEGSYDLVVLDLMLPHLDGLEVCRRIRARSTVPIRLRNCTSWIPSTTTKTLTPLFAIPASPAGPFSAPTDRVRKDFIM